MGRAWFAGDAIGVVVLLCAALACSTHGGGDTAAAGTNATVAAPLVDSPAARAALAELRARFVRVPAARPAIEPGVATGFERVESGFRPVVPKPAAGLTAKTATVTLPAKADGAVHVEDDATHVAVDFALAGAASVELAVADGLALYANGGPGRAHVVHRPHAEGTEDHVVFETRPSKEELRYGVDVSRAAGLRLAGNVLEFLDADGTPRLRMAPPSVVDATGRSREAAIAVEGCAVDTDPRGPWGRAVVAPGASACTVRVRWEGVRYPAVVDPNWTTTGSMAGERSDHTASVLSSGKVLVAGGRYYGFGVAGVELYNPTTGTWSPTDSTALRYEHTASVLANGTVLVAGGGYYNGPWEYQASVVLYDPTGGAWFQTGSMATLRSSHTACVLGNGKVLVAGGSGGGASAELYDPTTGKWSATGSMATARSGHTASLLANGKVLVAGGSPGGASAELYDPTVGTWSPTGSMTTARSRHTASVLASGKVLVAGGGGGLASAELYDPTVGTWSPTGSMATARVYHTASLPENGNVLVAGGSGASAEAY
jgi:hypothetical protein